MYKCQPTDMSFFEKAPRKFCAEVTVNATPEQIFEVFEDAHAWTVWAPPIQKVEWTSPRPFGLGTTRTVYMSGGMVGAEEFIAWQPYKRMAFCFTEASMNSVARFAEDYQLTENADGTVTVKWTMAMEPQGASKIFLGLFGFMMSLGLKVFLKKFKKLVEEKYSK